MLHRYLNCAEFARKCKISPSGIHHAITRSKVVLNSDSRIDIKHPTNKAYFEYREQYKLSTKEVKKTKPKGGPKTVVKPLNTKVVDFYKSRISNSYDEPTSEYTGDMKELSSEMGASKSRGDLEVKKLEADIELKHIKIAKERGTLVDRSTFGAFVMAYLDTLNQKLLAMPMQVVDPIIALSSAKDGRQRILETISGAIAIQLKETKRVMIEKLGDEKCG